MNVTDPKVVVFGAGAIGGSVGAWIAAVHDSVRVFDTPAVMEQINREGITTYRGGDESSRSTVRCKVLPRIEDMSDADVVLVCVKNYSLEGVCGAIKKVCGDRPLVIGMQNGAENQAILPRHFSKVLYCVIGYNAWPDSPTIIGYQKKGPLILGTPDNSLGTEASAIAALFSRGVETVVVDHLQDAVHSKMIINLTNSLTTLIGLGFQEISDYSLFQKALSNLLYEGVKIVKVAGYRECKIGGMPPWLLMQAGATLPGFLTRGLFKKNVKKMVISSMAQDIIKRGGHESELDTINGYILELARKHNIPAPYNQAVYDLCRREFHKTPFQPLDIKSVWAEIEKRR